MSNTTKIERENRPLQNTPINLIGISGKKGSGKNTVASFIQGIIAEIKNSGIITKAVKDQESWSGYKPEFHDIVSFMIRYPHLGIIQDVSGWEQKAFAAKLKQITSLLTGIPIAMLENQEFKEKPMPEQWSSWMIPNGTSKVPPLFPLDVDIEWIANGRAYLKRELTPRAIFQLLATEGVRDVIHPNAWVNALFADYNETSVRKRGKAIPTEDGKYSTGTDPKIPKRFHNTIIDNETVEWTENVYPNWIITDVRFPNEVKAIQDRGGVIVRVERPLTKDDRLCEKCHRPFTPSTDPMKKHGCIYCGHSYTIAKSSMPDTHISETALDNWEFDYTIMNNGTLEDLKRSVEVMLKSKNII